MVGGGNGDSYHVYPYILHYVVSLIVIMIWLYSVSFKPITQNPYILGPIHSPSLKCAYGILEAKLLKIMNNHSY